jgi:hypothetical protein
VSEQLSDNWRHDKALPGGGRATTLPRQLAYFLQWPQQLAQSCNTPYDALCAQDIDGISTFNVYSEFPNDIAGINPLINEMHGNFRLQIQQYGPFTSIHTAHLR